MRSKAIIAAALAVGPALLLTIVLLRPDEASRIFDEEPESRIRPSQDLDGDKAKMWRLVKLSTVDETGKVEYLVSPVSAINAAVRVMEAEKAHLIGLTPEEALARLKCDQSHRDGSYNFPFYPLGKNEQAVVLRFDCGNFGWQFDLLLDDDGRLREIRQRWIK